MSERRKAAELVSDYKDTDGFTLIDHTEQKNVNAGSEVVAPGGQKIHRMVLEVADDFIGGGIETRQCRIASERTERGGSRRVDTVDHEATADQRERIDFDLTVAVVRAGINDSPGNLPHELNPPECKIADWIPWREGDADVSRELEGISRETRIRAIEIPSQVETDLSAVGANFRSGLGNDAGRNDVHSCCRGRLDDDHAAQLRRRPACDRRQRLPDSEPVRYQ